MTLETLRVASIALPVLLTSAAALAAQDPYQRELASLSARVAAQQDSDSRLRILLSRSGGRRSPRSVAAEILLSREAGSLAALRSNAVKAKTSRRRTGALAALWRREKGGTRRAEILHTAITDPATVVLRNLLSRIEASRDQVAAIEVLVAARIRLGKSAPRTSRRKRSNGSLVIRGHFAHHRQTSYVRGFQVEVASRAKIAKPQTEVLGSGAILDTRSLFSQTRRFTVLRRLDSSLRRIRQLRQSRQSRQRQERRQRAEPRSADL